MGLSKVRNVLATSPHNKFRGGLIAEMQLFFRLQDLHCCFQLDGCSAFNFLGEESNEPYGVTEGVQTSFVF